jgi:hypothetical protein
MGAMSISRSSIRLAKVFFCVFFTIATFACAGVYSGGSGTAEDPYKISTVTNWQELIATSIDWNKRFILLNDVNFAGVSLTPVAPDTDSSSGGFQGSKFTGIFDGKGHILRNAILNHAGKDCVALFGYLGSGGIVKNLGVENVNVTGRNNLGGMCGYNNSGTIINCYSTGSISGDSGSQNIGGLVGYHYDGTITNCYSFANIFGYSYIGGLVGRHDAGIISNCYSTGSVTSGSQNNYLGGLVGFSKGSIFNSFWDIQTSGQTTSNGGKGRTNFQMIRADNYIGWNTDGPYWTIDEGRDYPRLSWEDRSGLLLPSYALSDFLAGNGSTEDPYRVITAEHLNIIGLFTSEWDKVFLLETDIDLVGLKGVDFNRIGISEKLPFRGSFDGQGYVIRNYTYASTSANDCVGMFGFSYSGTIVNLNLVNVSILSSGDYIGGLIGHQYLGIINNCHVTGKIEGNNSSQYIGGLVGMSYGNISNCSSSGNVSGGNTSNYIGGLVGWAVGVLDNCSSNSTIYGGKTQRYLGGLVGSSSAVITNSVSTGSVFGYCQVGGLVGQNGGEIVNCYRNDNVTGGDECVSIGGIVGLQSNGIIRDSHNSGDITGGIQGRYLGGIVGVQDNGSINNCSSTGNIIGGTGSHHIGGVVGDQGSGSIINCFSNGDISGSDNIGGLIGQSRGIIKNSFSYTNVSGFWDLGGFVGYQGDGSISDCYSTGRVIGNGNGQLIGGFVGSQFNGTINNCFSTGRVSNASGNQFIGGFAGDRANGSIASSFWDIQTSGKSTSAGGFGKTTFAMKMISTFTGAGWDFAQTWAICEGTNYPRLKWQIPKTDWVCPDGVGMEDLVYLAGRWMAGTPATIGAADADGSGKVDLSDFEILAANWMSD